MSKPLQMVRRWWHHAESDAVTPPAPAEPVPARSPLWQSTYKAAGIPATLVYPSTTLSRLLDQTADRFGDAIAMIYNERQWTYHQLLSDVNRMAGGLAKLGVRRKDRVLLALPNCPEFVTGFFAIQKLGAIPVNIGPLMGSDDIEKAVAITTPQVAIGLDLRAPILARASHKSTIEHWVWTSLETYQSPLDRLGYRVKRWYGGNGFHDVGTHVSLAALMADAPSRPPTVEPDANAIALLQPTGGTSGTLKLAQLTHRNLLANALQISICMGCRPGQDRVLTLLPLFHAYGLSTCLIGGILTASQLILLTRFNAEQTLEAIRRHRPTVFPLVPAICDAISDEIEKSPHGEPIQDLRLCFSGAAPLSRQTAERFKKNTGADAIEGYGLTEASPVTHSNLPGHAHIGTIGLPMPDTEVRIVHLDGKDQDCAIDEAGEMLISGPQVMAGYFGDPEQNKNVLSTDASGKVWLHTGDVASMDKDGFFHIHDRKKDMIIRSGMKVYPSRVENLLRTHAAVKDVAVFGRPDPVHTEQVIAAVVPVIEPQNPAALATELRAFCKIHLAPYEVPESVEFVGIIPKTALGKVQRGVLRKMPADLQEQAEPELEADKPEAP